MYQGWWVPGPGTTLPYYTLPALPCPAVPCPVRLLRGPAVPGVYTGRGAQVPFWALYRPKTRSSGWNNIPGPRASPDTQEASQRRIYTLFRVAGRGTEPGLPE